MPPAPQKRIRVDPSVDLPVGMVGTAAVKLVNQDGKPVCFHCFAYPSYRSPQDTPEWFNAQLKIAQSIADAINAAPNAAIEYIRQSQRESILLQGRIDRKSKP